MATKREKGFYSIDVTGDGNWTGKCPDCGERFTATDKSVSQAHVIATIKSHAAAHPVKKMVQVGGERA